MKTAPRLKEKGSLYIKNMCMYNLLQSLFFPPLERDGEVRLNIYLIPK